MTCKGYLKPSVNAGELARAIAELEAAGVVADDIVIGDSPLAALERIGAGGVLVLRSLSACGGIRVAAELFAAAAARNIVIRTLEEGIDTTVPPPDWASAAALFQHLEWTRRSELSRAALRGSKTVGGRGAGRPKPERLKRGLCDALVEYYTTGRSVRDICSQRVFDPSVLYRCIDQNKLPRRSEIADNPSCHPFAEGRVLRVRMGVEWVSIQRKTNHDQQKISEPAG